MRWNQSQSASSHLKSNITFRELLLSYRNTNEKQTADLEWSYYFSIINYFKGSFSELSRNICYSIAACNVSNFIDLSILSFNSVCIFSLASIKLLHSPVVSEILIQRFAILNIYMKRAGAKRELKPPAPDSFQSHHIPARRKQAKLAKDAGSSSIRGCYRDWLLEKPPWL